MAQFSNGKTYNTMGLPMNITRGNPIPIDISEIWYALGDEINPAVGTARYYAKNDPTAYVGQTLKVIEGGFVDTYVIINEAGALARITPIFVGTRAEYETKDAAGEIAIGTIVIITDDNGVTTGGSTSATLGQAILGYMKLGQI